MGSCESTALEITGFNFVPESNRVPDIWKLFDNRGSLGSGVSCRVLLVSRKCDGKEFVLKEMSRTRKRNEELFTQEVTMLLKIQHPNIIQLEDCYIDANNYYICLEICNGSQLFDDLQRFGHLPEKMVIKIARTLLETTAYLHKLNIVHRDIKPENMMFKQNNKNKLILVDWGESIVIDEEKVYEDVVGTSYYLAPECTRKRTGKELKKTDMWAIGVTIYMLLTGKRPFGGNTPREVLANIRKHHFKWPSNIYISLYAKYFVESLLEANIQKRMSANQALQHPWIFQNETQNEHVGALILEYVANYHDACRLKKLIVQAYKLNMTRAEKKMILSVFDDIDSEHRGYITKTDIVKYLFSISSNYHESKQRARDVLEELNPTNERKIRYDQFVNAYVCKQVSDSESIEEIFNQVDTNLNRMISDHELQTYITKTCGVEVNADELQQILSEIDINGDGSISFMEFSIAMSVF